MAPARVIRRTSSRRGSLPERSPEKHTLEHFERFCFSLQLPDHGGRFRLESYELGGLEDYFKGILETLWLWPTGMGKSTILGALALHHGTYVREAPNVFVLGGLGNHGRNTLDAASGFVDRSEDLSRWWRPQEYGMGRLKSMIDAKGVIKVSSAGRRVGGRGGSSQEGADPTLILVEEDHRHEDNGAAVATLISKMQKRSSRQQVQIVHATTAGDTMDSPLGRLVERATDVKAGAVVRSDLRPGEYYRRGVDADGDLVMHEFSVPDHIQPPGHNPSKADLDAYLKHVKAACPASMVTLRSLRLTWKALSATPWIFQRQNANQWVTQGSAALDRFGWNARAQPELLIPEGAENVFVGFDSATKWASTAIIPVWIDPKTRRPRTCGGVILKSRAPGARRRLRDAIGVLEVMQERWPKMRIVFDRNYGGGYVAEQLEEDHGLIVIDHGQGVEFELASMLLGEMVDQQGLDHDGDEEVTEQVLGAVAQVTHHGKRWRLDAPGDGKLIDAADALAMALHMAIRGVEDDAPPLNLDDYRIGTL